MNEMIDKFCKFSEDRLEYKERGCVVEVVFIIYEYVFC